MRKRKEQSKLVITVRSDKKTRRLTTESVFDNRTQEYWTAEHIHERGIENFLDLADLKETANWNTNGDDSKYQFKWGQSCKLFSTGYAFIYD